MSITLKFFEISDKQIQQMGVQALANRPNQVGQYGKNGLSAEALKEHFDGLAKLLAERINDLYKKFGDGTALKYIDFNPPLQSSLPEGSKIKNLYDLEQHLNGSSAILAKNFIHVEEPDPYYAGNRKVSLQAFFDRYREKVAEIAEILEALDENKAGKDEQADLAASVADVITELSRIRSAIEILDEDKIDIVIAEGVAYDAIESIPDATEKYRGMMTPTDKKNLNTLLALLQNENEQTVDAIDEVLKVFESYPQGADLAALLAAKAPIERALPSVTIDDNGKVPIVVDGVWTLGEAPAIEEVALA